MMEDVKRPSRISTRFVHKNNTGKVLDMKALSMV